jgi:hypothetical protein
MNQWHEFSGKGLPRAIPAEGMPRPIPAARLQRMLESSAAFCSWDSSTATFNAFMDSWPFLFSSAPLSSRQA